MHFFRTLTTIMTEEMIETEVTMMTGITIETNPMMTGGHMTGGLITMTTDHTIMGGDRMTEIDMVGEMTGR